MRRRRSNLYLPAIWLAAGSIGLLTMGLDRLERAPGPPLPSTSRPAGLQAGQPTRPERAFPESSQGLPTEVVTAEAGPSI